VLVLARPDRAGDRHECEHDTDRRERRHGGGE